MRTVEQTSDELVEKFRKLPPCSPYTGVGDGEAIQCAIIAVDEIIKCAEDSFPNAQFFDNEVKFQKQLKQELETRLNK